MVKIPFVGRGKKKGEEIVEETEEEKTTRHRAPKADVHPSEAELGADLRGDDSGDGDRPFKERGPTEGVRQDMDIWTKDRLLNTLYNPDYEKLPMVTNTPKQQFNAIVIGDTFNEVVEEGSKRKETIWRKLIRNRDTRAPSVDGSSRNELVHIHDAQTEGEGMGGHGSVPYGG